MKTVVTVFVVVCLVVSSPLFADTILLQEDFEGGVADTKIDGHNGWSGDANVMFDATVIDQGQSAGCDGASPTWPGAQKAFSHTIAAGESYVLTGTLLAQGTTGQYADLRLNNSTANTFVQFALGYGDLLLGNGEIDIRAPRPQATTPIDVKGVFGDNTVAGYYRAHGDSTWLSMGTLALPTGSGYALAGYDQVAIHFHGGYPGEIDTIQLTATAVPEPTSFALLTAGILGLLAYAWRKRK
jgi:hypothetical protein